MFVLVPKLTHENNIHHIHFQEHSIDPCVQVGNQKNQQFSERESFNSSLYLKPKTVHFHFIS